jgi:patatin-like phospholipase/acyl hydrolase
MSLQSLQLVLQNRRFRPVSSFHSRSGVSRNFGEGARRAFAERVGAFQILCLSGGGFRGLYSAALLEELETRAAKPLAECFDLIAGTSIGGIIGLGLAAGSSAKSIRLAFEQKGQSVFSAKRPLGKIKTFGRIASHLRKPVYSAKNLAQIVDEILPEGILLGELNTRVIVPSVNLSKGKPQVFKTPHDQRFENDHQLLVRDVALATSAAPTFFPPHEIDNELFADGGLYANSPDDLALHEALHFLKVSAKDVRMLSIGTTTSSFAWSAAASKTPGYLDWSVRSRLMNATIGSQQINSDYVMKHRLQERYVRLDAEPSAEQAAELGLDVASEFAKQDLKALAKATSRANLNSPHIRTVLSHERPEPRFFHGPRA